LIGTRVHSKAAIGALINDRDVENHTVSNGARRLGNPSKTTGLRVVVPKLSNLGERIGIAKNFSARPLDWLN
jgi:hypothetical protein